MSGTWAGRPWIGQYQDHWELKSADGRLPKWFRLVCLALGKHAANGHAMFGPGDVANMLGTLDTSTGELVPDSNVARHIAQAVSLGFLERGSGSRCLVVPGHSVKSAPGNPLAPCIWHHGRRRGRASSVTE